MCYLVNNLDIILYLCSNYRLIVVTTHAEKPQLNSKPHVVAHVQLPKTEAEFDNILGFCLGQNHWCEYIEGDLSFLCVIAGFNAEELTPKYPDFIRERVYALGDATRWWHEYGKEALLLNNV